MTALTLISAFSFQQVAWSYPLLSPTQVLTTDPAREYVEFYEPGVGRHGEMRYDPVGGVFRRMAKLFSLKQRRGSCLCSKL